MDMQVDESEIHAFRCHNIVESSFGCLQIDFHEWKEQQTIILWNRFTIIVKDVKNFAVTQNIHYPDIEIKKVYFIRNIFLCLDYDNRLHMTMLRLHESDVKVFEKLKFKLVVENAYMLTQENDVVYILVRKKNENILYSYEIIGQSKMKRSKSFQINMCLPNLSTCLTYLNMHVKSSRYFSVDLLQNVFMMKTCQTSAESKLLIISIGGDVYWTILNDNMENSLNILYSCPAPIVGVHFEKQICKKIYLSLTTGSLSILSCDLRKSSFDVETVYLNCSPKRMLIYNNNELIYTDGDKLWYTTADIIDGEFVKHTSLKIISPFDFIYCSSNGSIYCTTLQNILYNFQIDSSECFKDLPKDKNNLGQIPVPNNLNESNKIFTEILKEQKITDQVIEAITDETNLITAIALTRKSDLIIDYIVSSVKIYDNITELDSDTDVLYIYHNRDYFEKSARIYVVNFEILKEFKEKFNDMKKAIDNLWHLDIRLSSCKFCNTSAAAVKLKNSNNIKIAIPIMTENITFPYTLEIKLIALIPSIHNKEQHFWCILPTKSITIDANYYLRLPSSVHILKKFYSSIEESDVSKRICSISESNSISICNIKIPDKHMNKSMFHYYLKLPHTYKEHIKEFSQRFVNHINKTNQETIGSKMNELLCNSSGSTNMKVLDDEIDINLYQKDSLAMLKVSSKNNIASWNIYVSILNIWKSILDGKRQGDCRMIPHFDYMILQKLRDDVQNHLSTNEEPDLEMLLRVSEEFYRDIIGILPI